MNKHQFDIEDENEAIVSAIKRISIYLDKTPTQQEYKRERKKDEPSLEQITYRLGKWSSAVQAAGLEPNPFQQPPRNSEFTKEQLVEEFVRVSNKLGCLPSMNEFRANACYSWKPYKTNWGSWKNAVDYILEQHAGKFNFEIRHNQRVKKSENRKHLKFPCPLIYEPQNEYETIALFCFLADELNFKIKKIRSEFPDAILVKNDTEILVEFEYLSSNYLQHCHTLDFDGIVICWRKDVEIEEINILSLEEYLRGRKGTK